MPKKNVNPPQSITVRIGDRIGYRYGNNSPLEGGEVAELKRGIPRVIVLELDNHDKIWLMVETPMEDIRE